MSQIARPGRIETALVAVSTPQGKTSPQPKVYNLTGDLSANGPPFLLFEGQAQNWSGSSILYDPTEADFPGTLEVAFDAKSRVGTEFFVIQPGVTYSYIPGIFTWIFFRFTPAYFDTIGGVSNLGKVVVSPSLIADSSGASPFFPSYTRSTPVVPELRQCINGTTGAGPNWQTNAGGTGIFAFRLDLSATSGSTGLRIHVKNIGASDVFIGVNSEILTDGSLATITTRTYPLQPQEELDLESVFTLNTPGDPTGGTFLGFRVYSADPAAAVKIISSDIR